MLSAKSRTGARLVFTDGTTSGTARVLSTITATPPVSVSRVLTTALRWNITLIKPRAAAATISHVSTSDTIATGSILSS